MNRTAELDFQIISYKSIIRNMKAEIGVYRKLQQEFDRRIEVYEKRIPQLQDEIESMKAECRAIREAEDAKKQHDLFGSIHPQ